MDYDELTLNPLLAEIEADTASEVDPKNKQRRYWTPKEEERFFEIWGRDNWLLTRHGKNTIFFAKWSEEMKQRFEIDVKPEEIQAKVNQTRAKFRSVKKQLSVDKNATRWKKYDIIEKILKNQYRPKDAEPVPEEALKRNRDLTENEIESLGPKGQPSPTSITSASNASQDALNMTQPSNIDVNMSNCTLSESNISSGLFNTELFSDHNDDIKQEYDDDIDIKHSDYRTSEFHSFTYPEEQQNHYEQTAAAAAAAETGPVTEAAAADDEPPQFHTLQTPQQLQQQQQQQQLQTQYNSETTTTATGTLGAVAVVTAAAGAPVAPATTEVHPQQHLTQHIQNLQTQQQQVGYDPHTTNSYTNVNHANNQNHYGGAGVGGTTTNAPVATYQYANNSVSNTNGNNSTVMQPPRPLQQHQNHGVTQFPRRRGRVASISAAGIGGASGVNTIQTPAPDSIECLYLDEVRKRNHLLDEQTEISRKRLALEERKVTLMSDFFPKCLELQEKILQKLNTN